MVSVVETILLTAVAFPRATVSFVVLPDERFVFLRVLLLHLQEPCQFLRCFDHQPTHFIVGNPAETGLLSSWQRLSGVKIFEGTVAECKSRERVSLVPNCKLPASGLPLRGDLRFGDRNGGGSD